MKNTSDQPIEILVTIDQNYIKPLEVMMYSLKLNNLGQKIRIWIIYDNISDPALTALKDFGKKNRLRNRSFSNECGFYFSRVITQPA